MSFTVADQLKVRTLREDDRISIVRVALDALLGAVEELNLECGDKAFPPGHEEFVYNAFAERFRNELGLT